MGRAMAGFNSARRRRGFTLIELMVTVAVLVILATIAIPSYTRVVNNMRRSDGKAGAMAVAHAEERHFSIYQSYSSDFAILRDRAGLDSGMVINATTGQSPKGYYALTVTAGTTFTVTANPNHDDPECDNLTITSSGAKSASGTTPSKCW
jgi:type IV pilus assembly protein PilE